MAAYQVVCALLKADRPEEAEHLAEQLHRLAQADKPDAVSVAGSLWLIGAVIAARQTNATEAWRRLTATEQLAATIGREGNPVAVAVAVRPGSLDLAEGFRA